MTGLSTSTITTIGNVGRCKLSHEAAHRIADALDVTISNLFDDTELSDQVTRAGVKSPTDGNKRRTISMVVEQCGTCFLILPRPGATCINCEE